jgi:NADP-dependent 3-hydroxy acid dehydrogenase YdfG
LKYFFTEEIDLTAKYGVNTWVLVTGCSSGQGKRFAIEFAKRGFNIILTGHKGIEKVESYIKSKHVSPIKALLCVVIVFSFYF